MPTETNTPVVLRSGGVAVVVAVDGPHLPRVLHWGADVGDVAGVVEAVVPGVARGTLDGPWPLTVLPGAAEGWPGRAAVSGDGGVPFPRWTVSDVDVTEASVTVTAVDTGLEVTVALALAPSGVLSVDTTLRNTGEAPYRLAGVTPVLPLPGRAGEVLDLTGRWCREHVPQRAPLRSGVWARETWRGRPGHDATQVLVAGTPGFGFRAGEVWGVHVACGGNAVHLVEKVPEAPAVLGGGELLLPGEVELAPGASYSAPTVLATWSDAGLDGFSARLHSFVRARPSHPSTPRPVTLNTWEAVYFDHDLARLTALADQAAAIGVERYVLDDGWFLGRRDDTSALGDWTVDPEVWPDGLHPLVDHVRGLGMQFGLWVEPEMVSPDSELARAHPEWILAAPGRLPPAYRHQVVLDLANPDAFAHILDALDALVTEYDLAYLKWDHNRDVTVPVHDGRPGAHAQTAAVQRLFAALRERHPGLEIESCASGGGRADLATLAHTDRIWASDTTDPVERQAIQRWTGLLLPPELIGAHVGAPFSHTTDRWSDLGFRLVSALFGHAGIEWDLATVPAADLERLRAWVALHKELRPLLHGGVTVRADDPGEGTVLHGVIGPDAAVFAHVRLSTGGDVVPPRLVLPGLAPERLYRVRVREEIGLSDGFRAQPPWTSGGVTLTGAALAHIGLAAPLLHPGQAVLLHLTPA